MHTNRLADFEIYRIQLELAENRQNIRDSKTKIVNRHLGKISQKNRQNDEKSSRLAALLGTVPIISFNIKIMK